MDCLPASRILFGFVLLIVYQGCWSRTPPPSNGGCTSGDCVVDISCILINLEYVHCNWTRPQTQMMNYTFRSKFSLKDQYQECPQYLQEHAQNVGCRIPSKDQFDPLYTILFMGRNKAILKNYTNLADRVKLNPPYNISVNWTGHNGDLCLYWESSIRTNNCVRYMIQYRKDQRQVFDKASVRSYCMPYVSTGVYTFQVRSKLDDICSNSNMWSDWSDPVQWGNYTEIIPESEQSLGQVWVFVLGGIALTFFAVLLCYCERIKIILLPVVPDPSKNLKDLFYEHNGNVESWVLHSGLKGAFETDYTETPCVVSEPNPTLMVKGFDEHLQPSS